MTSKRQITRKRLIATMFVIVVVGIVIFAWTPESAPEIRGQISQNDLFEVTRLVRAEMKQPLLPDFSWDSIRWLPASIRQRWSERILSIHTGTGDGVEVRTGTQGTVLSATTYQLQKSDKGWQIAGAISAGPFVAQPSTAP